MKPIQIKKQTFKVKKSKNKWKVIFFIIWTGIFILSSCFIVKGNSIVGEEFSEKRKTYQENIMKSICVGLLEIGSPLFDYGNNEIMKNMQQQGMMLGRHWTLASYLQENGMLEKTNILEKEKQEKETVVLLQKELLQKDFPFLVAEAYMEDETTKHIEDEATEAVMASANRKIKELKETLSTDFLLKNFYIVDSTTSADSSTFQVKKLLEKDMTMEKTEKPQILIYHTHGKTEGFKNEKKQD